MEHLFSRVYNLTRTADTNAYGAGDVVGSSVAAGGGVLTIPSTGGDGSPFIITGSELRVDLNAVTSGMTSFRLHLYNSAPGSNYADNAAWDLPSGDRTAYLGYVDLGTPVDVGATLFVQTININKEVRLSKEQALYAYLVTVGAYTPASATTMMFALHCRGF